MLTIGSLEKAKHYIESRSRKLAESEKKFVPGICITISREAGAGADIVSNLLIDKLANYRKEGSREWTIFDKNLIEKVLEDHNLPHALAEIMDKHYSSVQSIMNDLFSNAPSTWILVQKTSKTILQLAQIGNVVIIGRAANIVTAHLKNTLHIRLVSTNEDRIKHIMELYNLNYFDAESFLKKEDEARNKYFKTYFNERLDNPLRYHMVLNTHLLGYEKTSELIVAAIKTKFADMIQPQFNSL